MEQTVATFYQFANLPDCINWQRKLRTHCKKFNVLGTIILAEEGINGTVSSSAEGIKEILAFIRKEERFSQMPYRISTTPRKTFYRIRVVVRKEIVTLGDASINPNDMVGTYVEPKNWNKIIQDPDTVVIDTRNDYEVELGTFEGATNPNTETFCQWDEYVKENLQSQKDKKVAMFCTGGIRCEKASSHLLQNGFTEVYHLKGGILNYLENVEPEDSLWKGECFVFDHRVSVVHGLKDGDSKICFGCRWPLKVEDMESEKYESGICCPHCADSLDPVRRASLQERNRQIQIARKKKTDHLGQNIALLSENKKRRRKLTPIKE
ncbi:rhodanese-related sulfurtransferase [Opitutales bacterium]|nr:rhodanese-related sulfurtransferase [Opitutales bacterium]